MRNIVIPALSSDQKSGGLQQDQIDFAKFVHDIKGPLNSMKGLLKVAKMDVNNEIAKHYLELLEKCQEQLDQRIKNSLESFTNRKHNISEIDFAHLLNEIKSSLENIDGYSVTEFKVLIGNKRPFYSHYDSIYSIFQNIIENAIKYRKCEGVSNTINIVLLDSDEGVYIKIADNGIGIKSELLPSIFNMSVRDGDSGKDGHGMGLAIVKQLITRLEGKVSVDTKYGIGTTFNIELPCFRKSDQ